MFGRSSFKTIALARVINRRYISSNEMFEVFGNASSPKATTQTTGNTVLQDDLSMDPVVNIKRDFQASESSPMDSGFTRSLKDFNKPEMAAIDGAQNWSASFHGLSNEAFSKEAQAILSAELPADDIEITPDGLLYLPEIKYRRILNRAFGAGAWGLAPRGETLIQSSGVGGLLTREYGLVIHGRLVSIARGEQTYFKEAGIPTATEGCKSNALMRCCKDLGIASELWDPRFIRKFKKQYCENIFVEYVPTKKKKKIWKRKDEEVEYPFKR